MEIKKYGHMKSKAITCNHCGAELEYTYADIKEYCSFGISLSYITCPVCNVSIKTESGGQFLYGNKEEV